MPGARGEVRESFGAQTPGYRDAIRAHLARTLNLDDPDVRDLSTPPAPAAWSVSVSHTQDLGGWMALAKPARIGFDLELRARVREAVIRRMCGADEVRLVGDPALLWSAKEAMFKCVAVEAQPTSLSALTVTGWQRLGPDEFRFTGGPVREGFVVATAKYAAALCLA